MHEFLAALLIFGSFWFWFIGAVIFFIIMGLTENEHDGWALILIVLTFALFEYSDSIQVLNMIKDDPLLPFIWVGTYFTVGAAWSIVKWFLFTHSIADKLKEYKSQYDSKVAGEAKAPKFSEWLSDKTSYFTLFNYGTDKSRRRILYPIPTQEASRLSRWIAWWPTSFIWTLFNDFITKMVTAIRVQLNALYERISKMAFPKDIDTYE